jgi:hypothetical protein
MINWLSNVKPFKAIFMIVGVLILSYVLVHVFALLGVFIAVAFPLWWILFPQFTACIYCRNTPVGQKCKSCNQIVENRVSPPKNFRSVVLNTLTILMVSVFSIGTVYLEYKILERTNFLPEKPKLVEFIIPENKQYKIGEIFPVDLEIDTNDVAINAVQTDLSFDTEKLELKKLSLEKSFAQIFIQKEINNESGYLRLTGGLPNPGFNGEKGHFATAYFMAKSAGLVDISYLPSSLVLANNGSGTNILKNYPTITYLIKPEHLTDTEKEMQDSIFSSNVLGVDSTTNQILFFEDEDDYVMGVQDERVNMEEKESITFWHVVAKIDSWIIGIFEGIFSSFKSQ